ncbi:pro-adrenomedullin-like [Megalops cyprinoides]|uniref:pro-adrenomedullin-like n=1 Tax=Megalops cyprinoides TaxID=118141 RepID=UPI001864D90D|nr:pro-adrenomedullin-like [Megalops cyprinoides]
MKLLVQTFFCWCLLASVAPSVDGAKLALSSEMKKRLSIWLQSRTKRDSNSVSAVGDAEAMQFVRPEDVKDTLKPHSSTDIGIRAKRSSTSRARRSGCSLPTCSVHELAHRLHVLNNKYKVDNAPLEKISPLGYGRRRRSLPERRVSLRLEGGRLRPVWREADSRVHKLEALLRRT